MQADLHQARLRLLGDLLGVVNRELAVAWAELLRRGDDGRAGCQLLARDQIR